MIAYFATVIGYLIRASLVTWIIVLVWLNSHWSVALVLTLITFRFEIEYYIKEIEEAKRQRLARTICGEIANICLKQ